MMERGSTGFTLKDGGWAVAAPGKRVVRMMSSRRPDGQMAFDRRRRQVDAAMPSSSTTVQAGSGIAVT